jgi:NADH:ubiquinone oxidoreductase subunit F (NADH-binding)
VIDEDTCIVDMVKFFLTFLANESCGKCTPCREGLKQMLWILNNITEGKGQKGDLDLLETIAAVQQDAALCALGQGASGPLLTTLKYFREEYESHIVEKRCPGGVCEALSRDKIYTQVR